MVGSDEIPFLVPKMPIFRGCFQSSPLVRFGYDFNSISGSKTLQLLESLLDSTQSVLAWMSRDGSERINGDRINVLFHLLINWGIPWGEKAY